MIEARVKEMVEYHGQDTYTLHHLTLFTSHIVNLKKYIFSLKVPLSDSQWSLDASLKADVVPYLCHTCHPALQKWNPL